MSLSVCKCLDRITEVILFKSLQNEFLNSAEPVSFKLELRQTDENLPDFKYKGELAVFNCYCAYITTDKKYFSGHIPIQDIRKLKEIKTEISTQNLPNETWIGVLHYVSTERILKFILDDVTVSFNIPEIVDGPDIDWTELFPVIRTPNGMFRDFKASDVKSIVIGVLSNLETMKSIKIEDALLRIIIEKYFNSIVAYVIQLSTFDLDSDWGIIWDTLMIIQKTFLYCADDIGKSIQTIPSEPVYYEGSMRTSSQRKSDFNLIQSLFISIGISILRVSGRYRSFRIGKNKWEEVSGISNKQYVILRIFREIGASARMTYKYGMSDFFKNFYAQYVYLICSVLENLPN